jgi:hypothetical protein
VRRPNEHSVHKQRLVRTRADDPDFETILCIPSGKAIETVKTFTRVEVVLRRWRLISKVWGSSGMFTAPHQMSFSEAAFFTTRLSLGERAGLHAGVRDERAIFRDTCVFLMADRMFVKLAG